MFSHLKLKIAPVTAARSAASIAMRKTRTKPIMQNTNLQTYVGHCAILA